MSNSFKFKLADGSELRLADLEAAGLSVIPVNADQPISPFGDHLHANGQTTAAAYPAHVWAKATGIMIMTGFKSQRRFSEFTFSLMDVDIEAAMIERYPEVVEEILQTYRTGAATTPCIARTKSGGLRLSGYLAPCVPKLSLRDRTDDEMLIEFFSLNAYSRWDPRYTLIEGSILNAPELRIECIQQMARLATAVGYRKSKPPGTPLEVAETSTLGDVVVQWDSLGRSQYLPKEHCKIREHRSNNDAVSFYKRDDGSIGGYCHACKQGWIEVAAPSATPSLMPPDPIAHPDDANLLSVKPSFTEIQQHQAERVRRGTMSPLALQRAATVTIPKERLMDIVNLTTSDASIKAALRSNSRVIAVNAPTGAGKDHQQEVYLVDTGKYSIETKPHGRLAEEKVNRLMGSVTAIRIYGILHGADIVEAMPMEQRIEEAFPEDRSWVCIQPRRVNRYIQKGGNRHQGPCLDCPVRDLCSFSGMNGQTQLAQDKRAIVSANNHLFLHPVYENQAQSLYLRQTGGTRIPRVAFIDEADPLEMFLACDLTLNYLHHIQTMWDGEAAADWAKKVTHILTQEQDLEGLQEFMLGIPHTHRRKIVEQLTKIRVRCTAQPERIVRTETNKVLSEITVKFPSGNEAFIAVDKDAYDFLREQEQAVLMPREVPLDGWLTLSLDAAYHLGVYGKPEDMNEIQILTDLPQVYSHKWNPFDNLYRFFSIYPRPEDAPMHFYSNTLHWDIPPVLPSWLEKTVMMSATLNQELLNRTLPRIKNELHFVGVKPTPLVQGSRIFRIRTGTYCRRTILQQTQDDNGSFTSIGLSAAGERFINIFKNEVKRDIGKTHALITYKSIVESLGDWIDSQRNITSTAHFGGLVGIDEMSEADMLWILGTPEISDNTIRRYAKQFYGNDTTPLDYTRTEDGTYTDSRMQHIHDIKVQGELLQAAGRARLNRTQGTIILLTSEEIPTVTNREEVIEFDYQDWLIDKNIEHLADRVKERQVAEVAYAADLHNTELTAKEVATRNQLTSRRVKRDRDSLNIKIGAGRRSTITEEQKQRISQNASDGMSLRQNAKAVGVTFGQIRRYLQSLE